jgi:TonB dependent receptor-like, beta-barrel/Carboxypeptidase regulatory-like domain/TonB-dependent Receptor Plug Domain
VKVLVTRGRVIAAGAVLFLFLSNHGAAGAASASAPIAAAQQETLTLAGTVTAAGGAPLSGATVNLVGPMKATEATDTGGRFSFSVVPGVYSVQISHGGFNAISYQDLVVTSGTSQTLAVSLSASDLSALRTIGKVTSTGRSGITLNTSAATTSFISGATFASLANPQINSVLQRIPDVTVQYLGGKPDTTIIVGGAQPYETQVLIDGHPLAIGKSGVWISNYFPSFLIGGVETQSGPGNTTPFANLAVGGTANLLTPQFTARPTAEFVTGIDSYQAQYSYLLATGRAGKLSYVVGNGTSGSNGPYFKKYGCSLSADNYLQDNTPASAGTIQFCGDTSSSLLLHGSTLKLRYDFTPSTSFEAGFVGAWGTISPEAINFANTIGPTTVVSCLSPPLNLQCNNPAYANLVGKTVNGLFFFPGARVYNNQTLFDGQFRTSIGNDTLLIRPYVGVIEPESITSSQGPLGDGQGHYPNFFAPPGTDPATFAAFCSSSFGSPTSESGQVVFVNGQQECFQSAYVRYEQDKLYGTTVSLVHPIGESTINFTYDFHGQSTFATENTTTNVTVPFSAVRYSTFSLTSDIRVQPNLGLDLGLYNTNWSLAGTQPMIVGGAPVLDANGNPVPTTLARDVARFDPHVAIVYHPANTIAYRASYGTSTTFPFIGQVSGLASYGNFSPNAPQYTGGNLVQENPQLAPETSFALGIGLDKRFRDGSLLSFDAQSTVIHNVFETLTQGIPTSIGQLLAVSQPINAARMRSELLTIKYAKAPPFGFGYSIAAAAQRSIVSGIPASVYGGGAGFPVNNVQVCGSGLDQPGIPTCIPYLKGYAQATYTSRKGAYAALGVDYEGKNNPFYQPPFALFDLTLRMPVTSSIEVQIGIENLLNTNAFSHLAAPNLGVPLVAGATNDNVTSFQTTYPSTLIPAPARVLRAQVRFHVGR